MAQQPTQKPGLTKQSITIPISGGVQEDADDFLFDAPHMAYVENGVYNKQGVISKPNAFSPELTASPFPDGGLVIGEQVSAKALVFLDDRGSRTYRKDTDAWVINDRHDQYTVDKIASGDQVAGGINCGGGVFANGDCLAVYETFSPETGTHSVTVEIRDTEGLVKFREETDGRMSPRVCRVSQIVADNYLITTVTSSGSIRLRAINATGWSYPEYTVCSGSGAANSCELDGYIFGAPVTTQSWYDTATYYRGEMRLGFAENANDGHTAQYAVCGAVFFGMVAWKDQAGQLKVSKVTWNTGTVATVNVSMADSGNIRRGVLDITYNENNTCGILVASRTHASTGALATPITGTSALNAVLWTVSTNIEASNNVIFAATAGTICAGAIALNAAATSWYTAWTSFNRSEVHLSGVKEKTWGSFTTSLFNKSALIRQYGSQRIVTKLRLAGNEVDLYFGLEEIISGHPEGAPGMKGGIQRQGSSPPAVKSRTTTLIKQGLSGLDYELFATLLAGTGRALVPSQQECNTHLNTLDLKTDQTADTICFVGRQQIVPEDLYVFVEDNRTAQDAVTGQVTMVRSLGCGIGRANVYQLDRITKASQVPHAKRGGSLYVGTARPSVITASGMAPLSPPGTPEILGINTSHPGYRPFAFTYSGLKRARDLAQMYAISGYTDENGNVYRSSPSALVYADGIDYDDLPAVNQPVYIRVAIPLMDKERTQFLELYVGMKLSEPLLVGTYQLKGGTTGYAKIDLTSWISAGASAVKENILGTRAGYTSGGQLGADPWGCFRDAVATSNRLWTIPIDFDGVLQYSKLFEENLPAEANGALVIPFGHDRRLEAVGTIDDKVVAFERDRIHIINGVGPTNIGTGSDFIVQQVTADVGCSDPQSVVETPDGLMFYSSQTEEFHLLTRNLEIVDIGKPIQDLTEGIDVLDGALVPYNSEVRFAVSGGTSTDYREGADVGVGLKPAPAVPRVGRSLPANAVLCYNYRLKKWSVLSGGVGIGNDVFSYDGRFAFVGATGIAFYYDDPAEDYYGGIAMTLETPWIKVGELQSYSRLYSVSLLGRYLSRFKEDPNSPGYYDAGDIRVTVKYDYEENGTQNVYTFRANKDLNKGHRDNLQFRFRPGRQKCQSVKLVIEEVDTFAIEVSEPNYTLGRGFEISGLDLTYGARGETYMQLGPGREK